MNQCLLPNQIWEFNRNVVWKHLSDWPLEQQKNKKQWTDFLKGASKDSNLNENVEASVNTMQDKCSQMIIKYNATWIYFVWLVLADENMNA